MEQPPTPSGKGYMGDRPTVGYKTPLRPTTGGKQPRCVPRHNTPSSPSDAASRRISSGSGCSQRSSGSRRRGGGVAEEVIPALIAAGKAAALGAASGAASFVVKKGLGAAMHREIKRRKATPAEMRQFRRTLLRSNPKCLIPRWVYEPVHYPPCISQQ